MPAPSRRRRCAWGALVPLALGIHSLAPQPGLAQARTEVWSMPTTRTPQLALSPLPPRDPRVAAPLVVLVSSAFASMASTRYQHHTAVDPVRGSYRFDCVGLVSWALQQATPQAWASLRDTMALRPGRIPSPPTLVRFFSGLAQRPQPGWQALSRVEQVRVFDATSAPHQADSRPQDHCAEPFERTGRR